MFNARSDERSAFAQLFHNRALWAAVTASILLQPLVVHATPLQNAFSTVGLSFSHWLVCFGVASSVLWLRELGKAITRQGGE